MKKHMAILIPLGVLLWWGATKNYLLFHTAVEFWSIIIACLIGTLALSSYGVSKNRLAWGLGCLYFAVAAVDFLHTLAYKGMGVFPTWTADQPTQFWILARYLESLGLVATLVFYSRKNFRQWFLPAVVLVPLVGCVAIFSGHFPPCFTGMGLTPFKIGSEYFISILLAWGIVWICRTGRPEIRPYRSVFILSLVLTIAAEMSFTLYMDVYGISNMLGHLFKTWSFYVLLVGFVMKSIKMPMETLLLPVVFERQAFMEALSGPSFVTDLDGNVTIANRVALALVGEGPATPPLRLENLLPQDRVAFRKDTMAELQRSRGLAQFESGFGGKVFVNAIYPISDPDGEIRHFVHTATDVTEVVEAKEALEETAAFLAEAQEISGTGSVRYDFPSGGISPSKQMLALCGFDPGEPHGVDDFLDLFHPEDRQRVLDDLAKALSEGLSGYEQEYRIVPKDGILRHFFGRCRIGRSGGGQPETLVVTVQDITQRKRQEAEILQRSRAEELAACIVSVLASGQDVDKAIAESLSLMRRFFSKGLVALYRCGGADATAERPVEWNGPPETGMRDFRAWLPPESRQRLVEDLHERGQVVLGERVAPSDGTRISREETGAAEFVLTAVFEGPRMVACLVLENAGREIQGSRGDLDLQRVIAVALGNALTRARHLKELRLSEERYRRIVEDQLDPVLRFNPDFETLFVNRAYAGMLGAEPESLIGRNFLEYVAPDRREGLGKRLRSISAENPINFDEEFVIKEDGELGWRQWLNRGLFDDRGKLLEIQSACRDITSLKNVERELRESEEKYRRLVEDMPALMSCFDEEFVRTFVNSAYCSHLQKKGEELCGHSVFESIPKEQREKIRIHLLSLTPESPLGVSEHELVRSDGTRSWIRWTDRALFDESGRRVGFQSIGFDIEELKKAEQQVRFFSSIVESSLNEIYVIDPGTLRFEYANRGALKALGYGKEEMLSMTVLDIKPLFARDSFSRLVAPLLRGEIPLISFETLHRRKDGSEYNVALTLQIFGEGEGRRFVAIGLDVSERARIQAQLLEKTAELDQLFENVPFALFLCGGDRRVRRTNLEASRMFGYEKGEMLGKTIEELVVLESDLDRGQAYSDEIFLRHRLTRFEAERKRRDGSLLSVSCIGFPLVLAGDALGAYVIYQDITERVRSEEKLRKSERKFRSLFDESRAVMLLISPEDGHIVGANRAAKLFYGYPGDKLLALNHSDLNLIDPATLHRERMRALEGIKRRFLSRHRLANGKMREIEAFSGPVELEEGTVLFSIIHDVSTRIRTENLLKFERTYMENLFELAPDAVVVVDAKGTVVRVNQAFCDLFGYTREESRGRSLDVLVCGEDPVLEKDAAEISRRMIEEGASFYTERTRVKKSGERFACRLITKTMTFPNGVRGSYVYYHDLTEEREREGELFLAHEVVKNSPVILFRWKDAPGSPVLYVSENIVQWGYTAEEITARESFYWELIHPDDQKRVSEEANRYIGSGVEDFEQEYRIRQKSGEWVWILDRTHVRREVEGSQNICEGVVIDITDRKRAEALATEINANLKKHIMEMDRAFEQTIAVLATTAEVKDPYTAGHQRKVAKLARAIAEALGMASADARKVELAALVHDLGKIEVPAEILVKPGKLTGVEFELIKTHPLVGYQILKEIDIPWPLAEIVYQHHERVNGAGYPRNLKGEEVLLEARIISVADTVEAMASHRPYRPALGIEAALEELSSQRGQGFDPEVVDACLGLFRKQGFRFEEG